MANPLAPSVTARDPKGLKFVSIVEAAYNKAGLSEEEAQRVNDAPGLPAVVRDFITANRSGNKFANEELPSPSFTTYPPEYQGPKPIADQIQAIAKIFYLDPRHALEFAQNLPALPDGAEGWFAIPSVVALAKKRFPEVTDPAVKYCRALEFVHIKIADTRPFRNYRDYLFSPFSPVRLRVHARTAHALERLAETQPGDILIIAVQLGMRHRGKSVHRAREAFVANEFGLGSIAGGSIALTHPERFACWPAMDMDLPGDEFSPFAGGAFSRAPYLCFNVRLYFTTRWYGAVSVSCGAASAFLP